MEYKFYDKDRVERIYNVDASKFIKGTDSIIYLLNNGRCLKLYRNSGLIERESAIADMAAFNKLMQINKKGFYKIYRVLFDERGFVMASELVFYPKKYDDILLVPMNYFIGGLNNLYDVALYLGHMGIEMHDLNIGSLVLSQQGIVIVDGEDYIMYRGGSETLIGTNIKNLYNAFSDLSTVMLDKYHKDEDSEVLKIIRYSIKQLFCVENTPSVICDMVRTYKRPIDYFRSSK